MSRDFSRYADIVEVPDVVGLHVGDAARVTYVAGLKLAQPDPDEPPRLLGHRAGATCRIKSLALGSAPRSLVPLRRAGVREPRRPPSPVSTLTGEIGPSTDR